MKKNNKTILRIAIWIGISIIFLAIFTNIFFLIPSKIETKFSASDLLIYYGAIISGIVTLIAFLGMWEQNQKTIELAEKSLELPLAQKRLENIREIISKYLEIFNVEVYMNYMMSFAASYKWELDDKKKLQKKAIDEIRNFSIKIENTDFQMQLYTDLNLDDNECRQCKKSSQCNVFKTIDDFKKSYKKTFDAINDILKISLEFVQNVEKNIPISDEKQIFENRQKYLNERMMFVFHIKNYLALKKDLLKVPSTQTFNTSEKDCVLVELIRKY